MNLHAIDLNLFLVFHAIYATRSVTLAGEQLNITQSAVSNSLKRLRERFNDALFVRTMDGMVPTPLAERLIGPATAGLSQLNQAIDMGRHFDIEKSNRLFRIAINEVGHLVMMPRLFNSMRELAPHIKIETVALSPAETRNGLLSGQIELAIGSWGGLGPAFYQQRLFYETFVVVMSHNNPLAQEGLTLSHYLQAEHLSFRPHGSTDMELESMLQRAGVPDQRNIVYAAAHAQGFVEILKDSNLLVTLPSRLARVVAAHHPSLAVVDVPFPVQPFQIRQQWHERVHQDPGHRWLRELAFALFNDFSTFTGLPDVHLHRPDDVTD
jgi:DNA-binding transcriptional LysR family regulator